MLHFSHCSVCFCVCFLATFSFSSLSLVFVALEVKLPPPPPYSSWLCTFFLHTASRSLCVWRQSNGLLEKSKGGSGDMGEEGERNYGGKRGKREEGGSKHNIPSPSSLPSGKRQNPA